MRVLLYCRVLCCTPMNRGEIRNRSACPFKLLTSSWCSRVLGEDVNLEFRARPITGQNHQSSKNIQNFNGYAHPRGINQAGW